MWSARSVCLEKWFVAFASICSSLSFTMPSECHWPRECSVPGDCTFSLGWRRRRWRCLRSVWSAVRCCSEISGESWKHLKNDGTWEFGTKLFFINKIICRKPTEQSLSGTDFKKYRSKVSRQTAVQVYKGLSRRDGKRNTDQTDVECLSASCDETSVKKRGIGGIRWTAKKNIAKNRSPPHSSDDAAAQNFADKTASERY